jgi:asparagine synthase (glutamine-hydrolysing)
LANRYRQANRWTLRATVRALLDRSTFAENLGAVARRISQPFPVLTELDFGWVPAPRMPPWATAEAVESVRASLREAAEADQEPLDEDRTRHQVLASLVFEGSTLRHINTVTARTGVSWEAPFLDDRVIEAALSVRITDRMVSGRYKPLLVEAVRDTVPAELLSRRDKGEFSAEAYRGLRENRARLLELCDDSRLAGLGLIDPTALRAALLNPGPMAQQLQPFESTVACEGWLRSHVWSVTGSQGGHP